ncbi:MAG: vitamin K epoxide reductase family protein [Nanoarchaeota archaeon]
MNKIKYQILLGLFLISLLSSVMLSFQQTSELCVPGQGCEIVHASKYNYTFGIQNSYLGVAIFSFLSIITFLQIIKPAKNRKNLIRLSVILSSIIVIYFLYLQQFVLKAYCKYCLIIDFSMLMALSVVVIKWKE